LKSDVYIIGVISCFLVILKTTRATATERAEISMPASGVVRKVWKRKVDNEM
jgi:hypothetical protein